MDVCQNARKCVYVQFDLPCIEPIAAKNWNFHPKIEHAVYVTIQRRALLNTVRFVVQPQFN